MKTKPAEIDLDSALTILENSVRRSIIKRLSQEPSYPLQLSKELGIGQQLIAKHLDTLEESGLVESSMTRSPSGPDRKEYALKKSVSITLDFAPNLFSARLISLSPNLEGREMTKEASALVTRMDKIIRSAEDRTKIASIGKVLSDIDRRLDALEEERETLLYLRNLAMSEVADLARKSEQNADSRRILYHILDTHSRSVSEISESVNLREETVRKLLGELEREVL
ncbi:MAG: helix-turn-helix domain-containing protein [Nitrososphaerota archaeon]|nr:helix-turn-helix domain-containing protein [Nitrososphaerota archaeon]